jgi:hypothetical protein
MVNEHPNRYVPSSGGTRFMSGELDVLEEADDEYYDDTWTE